MKSPPQKRIKLEPEPEPPLTSPSEGLEAAEELEDHDGEHCSICLQPYSDRTVIPICSHEFCFECLLVWTGEHITTFAMADDRTVAHSVSFATIWSNLFSSEIAMLICL